MLSGDGDQIRYIILLLANGSEVKKILTVFMPDNNDDQLNKTFVYVVGNDEEMEKNYICKPRGEI